MKKGFTLIELLAVIVILGALALITIPIVNNALSESKEETKEVSVKNYIRAVEHSLLTHEMKNNTIANGTYKITTNGKICINVGCTSLLSVDIDGEKPSSGSVSIQDNKVISISDLKYDKYYGYYKNDKITTSKEIKQPTCVLTDSNNNSNADVGEIITCKTEKFYVVENNTTTISMLTEKNIALSTTSPKQDNSAGTVTFTDSYYFAEQSASCSSYEGSYKTKSGYEGKSIYDENSNVYEYIEAYEDYLQGLGVSSADATLISASQFRSIVPRDYYDSEGNFSTLGYSWATGEYWVDTVVSGCLDVTAMILSSSNYENVSYNNISTSLNIRPLVIISSDEL